MAAYPILYKCTAQTLESATSEAAELGAHFGVLCREGVYFLYDSRPQVQA
jgi:hypothetical protein